MKKLIPSIVLSVGVLLIVITTGGCSKRSREAKYLQRADKYFAAGDYDQAEIEYINALRVNHLSPKGYGRLGTIAFEQGRLQRAYPLLVKSVQLDTNNLEYHLELGMFDLAAGRRDRARAEAILILSRRPDDPDAPGLLADSAGPVSEMDQIKAYLQKLTVPVAKSAPIEVAIADLNLRERNQTDALAAFQRARAADPQYGPLYGAMANYYWSEKKMKEADEAFKMSADSAPARSMRRIKYAQFKIQNGDVPGGRHILEETVQKAPDYLPALTLLANVEVGEKQYDKANEWLSKVLSRDPDNYEALFTSGRLGLITGDTEKAVAQFEKMQRAYPKSPQVLYQLGLAYNAAGDTTKAFSTLNEVVAQNTNFVQASMALAQMKIAKGDFSSAIVSLQQVIQQQPKLPEAQLLLADTYRLQGDLDAAVKIYRRVEKDYPDNAQTPVFLGVILMQQHKLQEARKEFTHALELAPDYMTAMEHLTELDVAEGHYSTALERVQREMAKNPSDPEPSLLIAKIYVAQKNVPQAVATLQKTIESHPDFLQGSFSLAEIYTDSNQDQKALEIVHALLAKHPEQTGSWMLLGMIEDKDKDFKAAQNAYEKVLILDPKSSVALNNLAFLDSEHGDLDKGYELARRARDLLPYDGATGDTLGWILYKKGDYTQAASVLRESATQRPNSADIQLHLGLALYMFGDEEGARVALQNAVRAKMDLPGLDEAKQRLSILSLDTQAAGPDVRATLEKQVATQPNDPIALSRLAGIYKREGNTDKAIATYESALKVNPKNVRALVDLAQLYASQPGQTGKALGLAKDAYKIAPSAPGVAQTLGHLALLSGDYKFSLNLLLEAAQQKPGDSELLYDLAQAAYSQGQVGDAQADMRNALQSGPNFAHATEAKHFLDLVPLAANPTQATAAAGQVAESLQQDPTYVPALMAMGSINEQKPDAPAAIQNYEKALAHYPDFNPAKRRLAILYADQSGGGGDKAAYEVAVKAFEAFPEDPDVARALGIILYRQGEYSKSLPRLKESAAQKPNDASLMFYLGMDQYQLKQKAESKKNLQRAVDLKLPDNQSAEAKRALADLK